MNAIDLYSGIGGWTTGMRLAGIKDLYSYEYWVPAIETHNLNFGTDLKATDIRSLNLSDFKFKSNVDIIVGSPPCTQFSLANKGGKGDIKDGLIDIRKFLEIVKYLKPKYWAMENVPRVAKILKYEISYGSLKAYKNLFGEIQIVNCSAFGLPQNRKRMIAGKFPFNIFNSYKDDIKTMSMGHVLTSLTKKVISDPLYDLKLPREKVYDLEHERDLNTQELRINRDFKEYHPIYNKMSFPDKIDRPSRTITATCTRVSRESIIVNSETGFRRLSIRERSSLQGFPITFNFKSGSISNKFKMVGNAVPPILSYYIFQSMKKAAYKPIKTIKKHPFFYRGLPLRTTQGSTKSRMKKRNDKRRFRFCVPGLRYGSATRFELSNTIQLNNVSWSFKFFYGTSKNIQELKLGGATLKLLEGIMFCDLERTIYNFIDTNSFINAEYLQNSWTSTDSNLIAFDFLDHVGDFIKSLPELTTKKDALATLIRDPTTKIKANTQSILSGALVLSLLNNYLLNPKDL